MKTNLFTLSKAPIIGAALLALAVVTASAEVEDKITKSLQVPPGGQLVVAVDRGAVEIKTADRESVDIEVRRAEVGQKPKRYSKTIWSPPPRTATRWKSAPSTRAGINRVGLAVPQSCR